MKNSDLERSFPGRIVDIPLPSLDEHNYIEALEVVRQRVIAEARRNDEIDALLFRFNVVAEGSPISVIYEDQFYCHAMTLGAAVAPALWDVVDAYAYFGHGRAEIVTSGHFALLALAKLDDSSLPVVARYLRLSPFHFGESDIEDMLARHGWSSHMLDFAIVWVEMHQGDIDILWRNHGLRGAMKAHLPQDFGRRYRAVMVRNRLGRRSAGIDTIAQLVEDARQANAASSAQGALEAWAQRYAWELECIKAFEESQ